MIDWLIFAILLFSTPLLVFAFAPRIFRRFCLIVCVPWLGLATFFPKAGADNPLLLLDAIPLAVVAGAVAVEVVMLVRRLLARRTAHD